MGRSDSHDLVILGGGPAGSAAAMSAARQGLDVLVIDKARFPRDKLCGGLFTGRARTEYQRIFGRDLDPALFEERRAISFHLGQRNLGRMEDVPPMYLTMRRSLDAHLIDLAQSAGARLRDGTRVTAIDATKDRLTLEDGTDISYRVLIGADGVNSMVARMLFGRSFDPGRIGFALEKEMPPVSDPDIRRTVRVDFGAAAWGYGWSFPKSGSTTIGVAGLHRLNPNLKDRMRGYAALLEQGGAEGMKGHFLPFGAARRRPGRGNILLVGDAAGLVDPITGEGIGYALASGRLAAETVALALREARPGDAAAIHRRATAAIRRSVAVARLLRPVVFSETMASVFQTRFAGSDRVKRAYLDMLAGDMDYADILWLVARRLPVASIRTFWSGRIQNRAE